MKCPLKIGECGSIDLWPENTLAAFSRAIAMGADGIELDVHLSKDGVLVVHHDEALKPATTRAADGEWLVQPTPLIKDLTFAELQAYDVGRIQSGTRYAKRYPDQTPIDGERIPSLEDVIDLVRSEAGPSFLIYTEIKTGLTDLSRTSDPITLTDAVLELIGGKDFDDQTVLISFDWRALAHGKKRAPHIRNAFTTAPFFWMRPDDPSAARDNAMSGLFRKAASHGADFFADLDWRQHQGPTFDECLLRAIASGPADGWLAWHEDITDATAGLADELGLAVAAWPVETPQEIERLTHLKIDAIFETRLDQWPSS